MIKKLIMSILKKYSFTYVFCYHRVIPEEVAKYQMVHRALYVTPETLNKHIRWMNTNGEIVSHKKMFMNSNKLKFIITFDDGWKDNYLYAFPILKKYNALSTIFISTDNINKGKIFWSEEIGIQVRSSKRSIEEKKRIIRNLIKFIRKNHEVGKKVSFSEIIDDMNYLLDRLCECIKHVSPNIKDNVIRSLYLDLDVDLQSNLKNMLLSWDDITIMAQNGVAFGSHTHTHAFIDRLSQNKIRYELSLSKSIIEKRLGKEIDSFAYPNGLYKGKNIQHIIEDCGYKYAFTLDQFPEVSNNAFIIPRILMYEDNSRSIENLLLRKVIKRVLVKREKI